MSSLAELIKAGIGQVFHRHMHRWSDWSPPYQRYDLTWRTRRRCRSCGEERVRIV